MSFRTAGAFFFRRSVLAFLAIGLLYSWWVANQYDRINRFNQRQLANAALVLKDTIETAVENVERFDPNGVSAEKDRACAFDLDQPYLTLKHCEQEHAWFARPAFSTDQGLEVVATRSRTKPKPSNLGSEHSDESQKVRLPLGVNALFEELSFVEVFDVLFVAKADGGGVLYQENPKDRRWRGRLRWGERSFQDSAASQTPGPRIQNLAEMLGSNSDEAWTALSAVSGRTTVTVNGEYDELYLHPVVISPDSAPKIVIGALVPVRHVVRQALAIDTYFVAVLSCVLLFVLLGIPFIKLATMHTHERLTTRDVRWLYVSSTALLAVWIFGTLAVDHYWRWQGKATRGIEELANTIAEKFEGEVAMAVQTLDSYDWLVASEGKIVKAGAKKMLPDWFKHETASKYEKFMPHTGLYIEQAAWVGPDGNQLWKITSDKIAKSVDVKERPYFKAVKEGNLYRLHQKKHCFFLAPNRSITDGKFHTFIAMRSRLSSDSDDRENFNSCARPTSGETFAAVATAKLLTVYRPPLPSAYGFVVINRDGRTLYHSDPRLSLRENFFLELGDEVAARALTYAGPEHDGGEDGEGAGDAYKQGAWLSTTYRERPHRLYFRKLALERTEPHAVSKHTIGPDFSGLYLVVFRDLSLEQAVVARAVLIGLAGPLLLLVVIVALAIWAVGCISARRDHSSNDWLWPHGSRERLHELLAFSTTLVIAAVAAASQCRDIGTGVFVVLPLATAAVSLTIYWGARWRQEQRTPLERLGWYVVKFAVLFVALVGVPAFALFRITLGHEFGTLIDAEQHWMNAQADDLALIMESDARADQQPAAFGEWVGHARQVWLVEWPAPFRPNDTHAPHGTDAHVLLFHRWIDNILPIKSEVTAPLWYQESSVSYSPPGPGHLPFTWVASIGLGIALVAVIWWIRWSARYLFFADTANGPSLPADAAALELSTCTDEEKFVLTQINDEHIANPRQRPIVLRLLARGLLVLDPDIQPSSRELSDLIRQQARAKRIRTWEDAAGERSWHSVRMVLFGSLAILAMFLITTQPGLQSHLAWIASAIVTLAGTAVKLLESLGAWVSGAKKLAAK